MLIVKCCLCNAIVGETKENIKGEDVTHTYCDACLKKLMNERIARGKKTKKGVST